MSDQLNKVLDLAPEDYEDVTEGQVPALPQEGNAADELIARDFDWARNNLYEIMEMSKVGLTDMFQVAKQSQHPKVYEALNNMLKTTAEMTKDLLEIHKSRQELERTSGTGPTTVNNNLFLTSDELLSRLEDAKEKRLKGE